MGITERIDAITKISGEYRASVLPAPKSVKIELTAKCNYKCTFCARSDNLRDQKEMDKDLFKRLLLEMREEGVEEIGLFYLGESFLCKWLDEAVQFAKHEAKFPYVFLTTNGSLCSPSCVRPVIENGLDSLKFSLNYSDADQFEEIARVKRTLFDTMVENIISTKAIRDEVEKRTGHRCGLYASYIEYDDEQGQRISAMVDSMRPYVDEIYGLPLYNQADLVGNAEIEAGWNVTAGNRGRMDNLRDALPCWAVFTEGHITWDGRLSACCFDHDGRFEMGDLTKNSFMDSWNSEVFKKLRMTHLNKNVKNTVCENCVAYS